MVALLTTLIIAGTPAVAAEHGQGILRGVLFEQATPAAGVRIEVVGGASGTTTADGAFSFALPAGSYRLRLRRDQREPLTTQEIAVVAGQTTEAVLTLSAEGTLTAMVEAPTASRADDSSAAASTKGPLLLLRGIVVSAEKGTPIADARIFVRGKPLEAHSTADGTFELALPPGTYELTAIHPRFGTTTLKGVPTSSKQHNSVRFEMAPAAQRLQDFTVTAPRIEGSTVSLLDERRMSAAVSDVMGAEEMAKTGDSDAAGALKRVTGVTIVGGRYVYVRGLGERYSSTLLNGSTLPSPEPERRVVPLDMVPTDLLDSVVIQKSYSPDMPAEFGGGVVQLRTRSYPQEFTARISLSTGYRQGTTFDDGLTYPGGSLDFLGIDDGTRALPDEVDRASRQSPLLERGRFSDRGYSAEELEAFGEAMPNVWSTKHQTTPPNFGLSATVGDGGHLFGKPAGFLAALTYANDWEGRERAVRILTVGQGNELEVAHDYTFNELTNVVTLAGILDFGIDLSAAHKLHFTTLLDRITDNEARLYEGFNRDVGSDIRVTRLRWLERMLLAQQIRGEHGLSDSWQLDWHYNISAALRSEPDRREVRYDREGAATDLWLLSDRPEGNQRLFSELTDFNHDLGLDLSWKFRQWGGLESKLKSGVGLVLKSRDVDTRRYKFISIGGLAGDSSIISRPPEEIFVPDNIGANGFQFSETTRQTDNYQADQQIWSAYALVDLPLTKALRLGGGVRVEGSRQEVSTFELFNPDAVPVSAKLNDIDPLPAAMLSWTLATDMVLRLGYARTLSRPDFRELSPATFNDVTGGRQISGNPDLERATIDNVDLRWEWYPDAGETLSLALFYKRFVSPIETIVVVSAQHSITYENADGAQNVGIELESRKSLSFVHRSLHDFFIGGNAALIFSRVELPQDVGIQTSNERALQGQSPYAVNTQLGYDNADLGTAITVLYNVFGPRIAEVGALGAPDVFEEPVHQLDVVLRQQLPWGLSLSLAAKNLINPRVKRTQGDQVTESYRRGRVLSAGLSASF